MAEGNEVTPVVLALEVGPLCSCCYVAHAKGETACFVIDPGADGDRIIALVERHKLEPAWILLTHSHFDHIGACDELHERYPAAVCAAHAECIRRVGDPALNLSIMMEDSLSIAEPPRALADGETVTVPGMTLAALHAPGHDPGHLVFYDAEHSLVFSGDVLFNGSIGRSDFPGADGRTLMRSLHEVVLALPDATTVYPGHGPSTTIGREKRVNPFLQ